MGSAANNAVVLVFKTMKFIFSIIAVLIVYGSLFPFNLSMQLPSDKALNALLNFDISKTGFSDLIANVVLFIPFGLFIRAAFASNRKHFAYPLYLLCAFIFAFLIQALQLLTSDRLPWGGDAVLNTFGCALGMGMYSFIRLSAFTQLHELDRYKQICMALAVTLIVIKLAPFAPSVDFGVLKDNIKALVLAPSIDVYWTFENTVIWLSAFYLLGLTNPHWAKFRTLFLLVVTVLGLKFVIISSNINLSQFAAGALALLLWRIMTAVTTSMTTMRASWLAALVFLAIVGNGLYPFELSAQIDDFKWLPFTGSLNGNLLLNIIATVKKLAFYGAFIWLLYLGNQRLVLSTTIAMVVLLVSEYLQTMFTNSVPESTDAFLALIMGVLFSQALKYNSRNKVFGGEVDADLVTGANTNRDESAAVTKLHNPDSVYSIPSAHGNDCHYIGGLDGLRAVAAMAVFMVHFQQFSNIGGNLGIIDFERWMINGNTGVALFFVLSGFLLSGPFWREIQQGSFVNIRAYMINRAVRIMPIYYCCLFGILALKGFQGSEANFNNIVSHVFFLHNLKDYQVMSLNPPFWTLAVEFQFYLMLPLLFLLFAKIGFVGARIVALFLIIFVYLAYRWCMQYLETYSGWPINMPLIWPFGINIESIKGQSLTYSLFAHLPHFLIGVLAASFFSLQGAMSGAKKGLAEAVFWLSAILVAAILATELDEYLQLDYARYNFPFIPLLLGAIVFSVPYTKYAKALLEFAPIKWIGLISYGLYIFHYPIQKAVIQGLAWLNISLSEHIWLFAGLSFGLTLLLSWASYVWIELPLLHRFKRKKIAANNPNQALPMVGDLGYVNAYAHATEAHSPKPSIQTSPYVADTTRDGLTQATMQPAANPHPISAKGSGMGFKVTLGIVLVVLIGAAATQYGKFSSNNGALVSQVFWAGQGGKAMIFDHHAHTTYSDGQLSVPELSALAFANGCDAFSITDHSQNPAGFSPQKVSEIQQMRKQYPSMLIFAGIELGVHSYSGREHVNIITTPAYESEVLPAVLEALRTPKTENMTGVEKDRLVFAAIDSIENARAHTIAIYNHPSRKDQSAKENASDVAYWNEEAQNILAFSGAPGHQRSNQIGSYNELFKPIDRWDPVVAEVGGTWDQLLAKGQRIWGAIASSDYHGDYMDYAPCEFARIHVSVPSNDYNGLIKGLQAGTFWADHGQLLQVYDFSVTVNDFNNRLVQVHPGGTLTLAEGPNVLNVTTHIERSPAYADDFVRVDVISNCGSQDVVVSSKYVPPEENKAESLLVLPTNDECFVRSRIVRETVEENDLSAYSNPIFIEF